MCWNLEDTEAQTDRGKKQQQQQRRPQYSYNVRTKY